MREGFINSSSSEFIFFLHSTKKKKITFFQKESKEFSFVAIFREKEFGKREKKIEIYRKEW